MIPTSERFFAMVERTDPDHCWIWTGGTRAGYGRFKVARRMVTAHRFSYEMLRGPIPQNLQLDHLCQVKACVNPKHMEIVTSQVNTLRGNNPQVHAGRILQKKYGSAFTIYLHFRRWYLGSELRPRAPKC